MSTTTELPDYSSPFGKNSPSMFINKPSVSNNQYQHYNTNGGTEYTNLTPLMTTNLNYVNPSRNGDLSNPSSTHSSRTRLANIANDDSGISNSSSIYGGHHISYGSPQMEIKNEDDLDPIPRDRCNTWPMRRPNLDINSQTSPLIHDRIPEEETVYDSRDTLSRSGSISTCPTQSANANSAFSNDFGEVSIGSPDSLGDDSAINSKKSTTRRNAWGNMSYADLITQAILNSPEKRLTLSQVYEWMVQNVPYFRDKGDSNSSAGWKIMEPVSNDDFYAIPRDRSNTWPLNQQQFFSTPASTSSSTPYFSPNNSAYSSISNLSGPLPSITFFNANAQYQSNPNFYSSPPCSFSNPNPLENRISSGSNEIPCDPAPSQQQQLLSQPELDANGKPKRKRIRKKDPNHITQKKPNPWGEESYSDLILKAIESAKDGRMKLNEIYEWFINNVPYFRQKSSSDDAGGWKNSIRHNLSLHSRFMRIQNEGAGKSSWWVINPDAKPGRNPRRRAATMESATKVALDKKRRGARKRVEMTTQMSSLHSTTSSAIGSTNSMLTTQHDIYNDQDDALNSNFDTFRGRTQSNLSVIGNSTRISPTLEQFDDFDFPPPPWSLSNQERSSNPEVNEIMGKTDQMRIDSGNEYRNGLPHMNAMVKMEVKTEPMMYQDVNGMIIRPQQNVNVLSTPNQMRNFGNMQQMPQQQQNHIIQQQPIRMNNMHSNNGGYYHQSMNQPPMYNNGGMMSRPQQNQQQWQNVDPFAQFSQQRQQSIFESQQTNGPLPLDLENLTLPDQGMLDLDLDAVIRHEMAHDQTMTFDGL